MKHLFIIKAGTTYPDISARLGDFDEWIRVALGDLQLEPRVVDLEHGARLPAPRTCAGVVMTGSPAMVTDELPWSLAAERWIPALVEEAVPFFGVCYGHQLLAKSMGGEVGFHPRGKEIGAVEVLRLPGQDHDPLFGALPRRFWVQTAHAQSVLRLPGGAVALAANAHEPHHAIRVGSSAWGTQFHPEFDAEILRSYIQEQRQALERSGRDVEELLRGVRETPVATKILRDFGRWVSKREGLLSPEDGPEEPPALP